MPTNWTATYSIVDGVGREKTMSIDFVSELDTENIVNPQQDPVLFARAMGERIQLLTTGFVKSLKLSTRFEYPVALPAVNSDVNEIGVFTFRTENQFTRRVTIPAFDENLIVPGTKEIDRTEENVFAFYRILIDPENATGDWRLFASDKRGDYFTTLETAQEDFQP